MSIQEIKYRAALTLICALLAVVFGALIASIKFRFEESNLKDKELQVLERKFDQHPQGR